MHAQIWLKTYADDILRNEQEGMRLGVGCAVARMSRGES
jgi:hypothetical protein